MLQPAGDGLVPVRFLHTRMVSPEEWASVLEAQRDAAQSGEPGWERERPLPDPGLDAAAYGRSWALAARALGNVHKAYRETRTFPEGTLNLGVALTIAQNISAIQLLEGERAKGTSLSAACAVLRDLSSPPSLLRLILGPRRPRSREEVWAHTVYGAVERTTRRRPRQHALELLETIVRNLEDEKPLENLANTLGEPGRQDTHCCALLWAAGYACHA